MALFKKGNFTLHSGATSPWLINAQALDEQDIDTLACMFATRLTKLGMSYGKVESIPTGGDRFAAALRYYRSPDSDLTVIADDVLTTGKSFEEALRGRPTIEDDSLRLGQERCIGVVMFARQVPRILAEQRFPSWVIPLIWVPLMEVE